ncbi:MAG TPA: hypothetical protein VF503_20170 [Sphingobium sp.]|uniref:hypothetical protein n=1 Tax=Sphingobium sp. TaxID=1912891 RepID=UPI002ED18FB7
MPRKPSPYANRTAVRQAVENAKAAGLTVGGIEVSPSGTVRVLDASVLTQATTTDLFAQLEAKGML